VDGVALGLRPDLERPVEDRQAIIGAIEDAIGCRREGKTCRAMPEILPRPLDAVVGPSCALLPPRYDSDVDLLSEER
jgi:hypothetical protein